MSRIKAKDTKPEIQVRKFLHGKGFRYRLHVKYLPGKPDIVMAKYKTVIFVHGCFWHGHNHCKYYVIPKTRPEFWLAKINYNIANDKKAEKALRNSGWKIITVWECQLRKPKLQKTLTRIIKLLKEL